METSKSDEWGLMCALALGVGTAALAYLFIIRRADLVSDWQSFLGLIALLILLSFTLSAVEAGFSAAPKDSRIAAKIVAELAARVQKVQDADIAVQSAGSDVAKSLVPRRQSRAAVKRWERFKNRKPTSSAAVAFRLSARSRQQMSSPIPPWRRSCRYF